MLPQVDVVLLTRNDEPLRAEVERGLESQLGPRLTVHRVVGSVAPEDHCRWDAIARARNEGKLRGTTPWLMFLDDDVVLAPQCVSTLVNELNRRPMYGALAADYLGERLERQVAGHVAMGATLFRREALEQVRFTWRENRCECQCCCDDLRRRRWAIDYCPTAEAQHLLKGDSSEHFSPGDAARMARQDGFASRRIHPDPAQVPSVCLVVCYFGPLPSWIKHYLVSCAHNPTIDFLIVTDQENFPVVPPNVRVKRLNKASFNALATKKIGVDVRLSHPRKLCDFKPVYGRLFEGLLEGWDYWGYTDLDVIYGDVRRFLSAVMLHEYDVFSARREYLVGHFTLFRNNSRMRTLYQQSVDFRATLQAKEMLGFDECGKQCRQRLQGKPLSDDAACDSMTHVVHRMMANNTIAACFSPAVVEWPELSTPGWRLRWRAGRLWTIDRRREAMYFHFHAFKHRRGYREPCRVDGDAAFEMSAQGIERAPAPIELAW